MEEFNDIYKKSVKRSQPDQILQFKFLFDLILLFGRMFFTWAEKFSASPCTIIRPYKLQQLIHMKKKKRLNDKKIFEK